MDSKKVIAVVGAAGAQGGAPARALPLPAVAQKMPLKNLRHPSVR